MPLLTNFINTYDRPYKLSKIDDKKVSVRWLGNTSCDYRRTHVEIFVKLSAGETIFNLPLEFEHQGTLKAIRFRSRSESIKLTLTSQPCYDGSDSIHPRSIIYQTITEQKDELQEFENLFIYNEKDNVTPNTYASIENLGEDTDGLSIIFTFGY